MEVCLVFSVAAVVVLAILIKSVEMNDKRQ